MRLDPMKIHLGLSREDAEARLAQVQAHYAESEADALTAIVPYLATLTERIGGYAKTEHSGSVDYWYGRLVFDLKQATVSASACVAAMQRESVHPSHLDYSKKDEPCF